MALCQSSPRAWGCFSYFLQAAALRYVFPTCVGVFLSAIRRQGAAPSLPHVRGGVSKEALCKHTCIRSSPRAWGCFSRTRPCPECLPVFPTCVGVFLGKVPWGTSSKGLPHVRGGVSAKIMTGQVTIVSSPRAWGCFCLSARQERGYAVFPTCVGVFLWHRLAAVASLSLPHVRGGVSLMTRKKYRWTRSSPRAWGCFFLEGFPQKRFSVFPTCVGVFPAPTGRDAPSGSLPHVRGGVSMLLDGKGAMVGSSPRAWGCFHKGRLLSDPLTVFPTCVGVFPSSAAAKRYSSGLPHVRGGVSPALRRVFQRRLSSPRAWGCFCSDDKHPAGTDSLPHVRGGVSHILCILVAETGSSPRAWGCFLPHALLGLWR